MEAKYEKNLLKYQMEKLENTKREAVRGRKKELIQVKNFFQ